MTHYEILGIRKTSTTEEIKGAYKKLIKKYHPDVYPGDKTFAEKKTQEINEAYDILSDPDKKREYDESINPNSTTSYTPPDYSDYTYNPSYYKSKRNSQAQTSKYSYENYRKSYNSTESYDFDKRYTNYHRSKTPHSNYDGNNPNSSIPKESIIQLTQTSKFFIISIFFIAYIIFFILNIVKSANLIMEQKIFDSQTQYNSNHENYNSNYDFDIDSYLYDSQNQTYEEYYNKKHGNTVEKNSTIEDEFDINSLYSDSELREIYYSNFTAIYPTFEDFKKAISDYYFQTFYQNY